MGLLSFITGLKTKPRVALPTFNSAAKTKLIRDFICAHVPTLGACLPTVYSKFVIRHIIVFNNCVICAFSPLVSIRVKYVLQRFGGISYS